MRVAANARVALLRVYGCAQLAAIVCAVTLGFALDAAKYVRSVASRGDER
jgi:hypothetical protein